MKTKVLAPLDKVDLIWIWLVFKILLGDIAF